MIKQVTIEEIAYDGQGSGLTDEKEKALVWGALPGEKVKAQIFAERKDFLEGVAIEVEQASPDRQDPTEDHFLLSSPWQIMSEEKELEYKKEIAQKIFLDNAGVDLKDISIVDNSISYGYRNEMEYQVMESGAANKLSLALLSRGRKRKVPIKESRLCMPVLNNAAKEILKELNSKGCREADIGGIKPRTSQSGQVIWAAYDKLGKKILGEGEFVVEEINNKKIYTGLDNFFQINLPVFEKVLKEIESFVKNESVVDFYGGVGAISVALSNVIKDSVIVESNSRCTKWAAENVKQNNLTDFKVETTRSEDALGYIEKSKTIILNPPREGLKPDVVERIIKIMPRQVIYLSCKPATQARDIKDLLKWYNIIDASLYNFFPRTPHIESLVIMKKI